MKNLSYVLSNELDAAILSMSQPNGGRAHKISICYCPCTREGKEDEEDLPDDFLVDEPHELIG